MFLLWLAVCLAPLVSGVIYEYTVDCDGSSCPNSYRMTQTLPTAGIPSTDPSLTCAAGDTIRFKFAANVAGYPFMLKRVPGLGTGNGVGSVGVTSSFPNTVEFKCDPASFCSQPGKTIFYQATTSTTMMGKITLSTACPENRKRATQEETLCQKYARLTNNTQVDLMTFLVGQVINAEVANATIKPFFDGTKPAGSVNFLDSSKPENLNRLSKGLVAFFGAALGCIDPTFPSYTGPKDMAKLHQFMPIGQREFVYFNEIMVNTLGAAGVTPDDQATIYALLDSFAPQIVNPKTICPKYADAVTAGNQTLLMITLVNAIVGKELEDPSIAVFFNGTVPPGSTNFLTDGAKFNKLAGDLVSFFGAALGCTDPSFPKYTGVGNMKTVHKDMPIGRAEFDKFNDIFVATLQGAGVDSFDLTTVRRILDSFASQIVNPSIICPKYAQLTGKTQLQLFTDLVTAVVTKELGDPNIKPFFDGTTPAGSIDFTTNTNEYNRLAGNLISFFGSALGCTGNGFTYQGNPDMKALHAKMPIDDVLFDKFNAAFIDALAGAGVTGPDQVTVLSILESFRSQIVNPTYICPKYAAALQLSQVQLMTAIVTAVVNAEVGDPLILPFFNGTTPPGSTNFLADSTALNRLAGDLVAFFGAGLGCTDPANSRKRFPAYTGNPDMKDLHKDMGIDIVAFTKFNDVFINTLANLGVTSTDNTVIRALLDSFQGQIVASGEGMGGDPDLIAAGYTFFQPMDCGIVAYWKPLDGSGSVEFAVRRTTDGFVALGFPNGNFQMVGSDAVIGWASSSGFSVQGYSLGGKSVGNIVLNSDLQLDPAGSSATEENGRTTIYFKRVLESGANPITDVTAVPLIASSLDGFDGLSYHSCRVGQLYTVNLLTGTGNSTQGDVVNRQKDAHGALMLIGWGIFLVLGLIVAGYGREIFKDGLWFTIHWVLQSLGLILTTVAFIISFTMVDGAFFNTKYHAQLGTAIMALLYIQFLTGVARPHVKPDQEKTTLRKIFEIQHPWTGRILLICATVNIFTGINLWWPFWVHIIYAVIVFVFAVIALVGEYLRRTAAPPDDDPGYKAM